MKIYLLSQDMVNEYDTYDSAVVVAKSKQDARTIHPSEYVTHYSNGKWMGTYTRGTSVGSQYENENNDWVRFTDIDCIKVKYLGETKEARGVICSSFNAG